MYVKYKDILFQALVGNQGSSIKHRNGTDIIPGNTLLTVTDVHIIQMQISKHILIVINLF